MLETERAPDSASDEVVLADTSAPESSMGDLGPARPATRSDMGLARRLRAVTWGPRKVSLGAGHSLRGWEAVRGGGKQRLSPL